MPKTTPLHDAHLAAGARMIDFGGWEMPIHYGSQIEEHHRVRRSAGMFDVSHMTAVDLHGAGVRRYLLQLLANDVGKLQTPGKALYSCMLNEAGGVVDDLIVYYLDETHYRVVVNAATTDTDLEWMRNAAQDHDLEIRPRRDLAMIAVQGPQARALAAKLMEGSAAETALALGPFYAAEIGELFVARTGYTGEDGFEISLPAEAATDFWQRLVEAGVAPCGLGARDTLRLEAGMNLYGQDMDAQVSPLESGLAWTVAMNDERAFIGRQALERQRAEGVAWRFSGFILEGRGVLRPGQVIETDAGEGRLTSGSYSPTLERAIGLGRIPADAGETCRVDLRGRQVGLRRVRPPFVRKGAPCEGIL